MSVLMTVASLMLAGAANDHDHGCYERPHHPDTACECSREVDFYRPWTPPPPLHVQAPGVRVYGRPINVPGPVVYVQGPPVYVDAPPVRVAPAQIYIQRPDVRVRPSEVIVSPPDIHFGDCPGGANTCPRPGGGY